MVVGVRFVPLKDPDELTEGTEFVIISASADISSEFGVDFEAQERQLDSAAIFEDLRIHEADHPIDPLLHGRRA